jgi:hypothetical protein
MKINKNLYFAAICSLSLFISACGGGSGSSNSSNNETDASALDTGQQYGQQPRDSTNTGAGADTARKTNTGQGNADPSGGTQNQ